LAVTSVAKEKRDELKKVEHPQRILIAEDSDFVSEIARTFREKAGYLVCGETADGAEAITKAR
jgi:hypothetical protein